MKRMTTGISLALEERRRLRGRAPAHIAIADRFSQLNEAAWRDVTRGKSFFHSAEYQQAFEQFRPANLEPRYALISDGDRPLAAVCMQIARLDLTQVGSSGARSRLAKLRSRVEQRVLICGNLLAYGLHGVCAAADADKALVWQALTEVLYRVRRAEKLAGSTDLVLIKDLDSPAMSESSVLRKLSYGAVPTEPNMVLMLEPSWRTHEDYLKSLVSKYRSDIKNRIFKKFTEGGLTIEQVTDVPAHADVLHALYLQVHGNATFRPFTLAPEYWPGLAQAGGSNVVMHAARQGEKLVGFIVTLKDGETAFAYHIGFDRAVADAGQPLYLRLLHVALEQAIAFGCRRVSFGRTALEPKARMGCVPEPTSIWVRHRHPMLNRLVQPLLKLVEVSEAPEFSPFKAAAAGTAAPVAKA